MNGLIGQGPTAFLVAPGSAHRSPRFRTNGIPGHHHEAVMSQRTYHVRSSVMDEEKVWFSRQHWRIDHRRAQKANAPSVTLPPTRTDREAIFAKWTSWKWFVIAWQSILDDVADRPAFYVQFVGMSGVAVLFMVLVRALLITVDSLPVLPSFFELVGMGYCAWWGYRFLFYKETRESIQKTLKWLGREYEAWNEAFSSSSMKQVKEPVSH